MWRYMPILKWKRGEQNALRYLTADQRQGVTPLVELQSLKAAPEARAIKAALPDYLRKVADQIDTSMFEGEYIGIDCAQLAPAYPKQAVLLLVVCEFLQERTHCHVMPVFTTGAMATLTALAARHSTFLAA